MQVAQGEIVNGFGENRVRYVGERPDVKVAFRRTRGAACGKEVPHGDEGHRVLGGRADFEGLIHDRAVVVRGSVNQPLPAVKMRFFVAERTEVAFPQKRHGADDGGRVAVRVSDDDDFVRGIGRGPTHDVNVKRREEVARRI